MVSFEGKKLRHHHRRHRTKIQDESVPANSPPPPAILQSYMGVIVSSSVVQSGSTLSGNVPKIVVIRTNPGYGPTPSQVGTGTVVATYCGH